MNRRLFLKSSAAALILTRLGRAKPPPTEFDVGAAANKFAVDLFAKLRAKEGNQFFSPFSVSTALAMTSLGAAGRTAEEMNNILYLTQDPKPAHAKFADLLRKINGGGGDRGYQLAVANALWGAKKYQFRRGFLDECRNLYGAGLTELDFMADPEKARKTINAWVEKQTRDRIKDLMPQGSIESDTRLVLTNAIHFKGDWATKFDKNTTRDEAFHFSAEKSEKVSMMHRTGSYSYAENDRVQLLALPYKGRELSMVAILPRKKHDLPAVESAMTHQALYGWIESLRGSDVIVALPRFKMSSQYQLVPTLMEMGMSDAFAKSANFSGMSETEGLLISNVIHKTFVEVNEEGSEAAAATGVVLEPKSARIERPKPTPVFRADHPFLFLIRDNRSGAILFLGRVANPA